MKHYVIVTERLNYYLMNENFEITQLKHDKKSDEHSFSGKWKINANQQAGNSGYGEA